MSQKNTLLVVGLLALFTVSINASEPTSPALTLTPEEALLQKEFATYQEAMEIFKVKAALYPNGVLPADLDEEKSILSITAMRLKGKAKKLKKKEIAAKSSAQ